MSNAESATRHDLAACYRIAAWLGWSDLVYTHISARIPGTEDILINRFGDMFHEVTASSLIRLPIADPDPTGTAGVNPAGALIHTAVHAGRPDVACVMHTHTIAGVAVACQSAGLLPISQYALGFYHRLATHGYQGIALLADEKPRLVSDLGPHKAMILRNHGLLTAGATIPEAFSLMYNLERACAVQIAAQAGGHALIEISPDICELTARQSYDFADQATGLPEWIALVRNLSGTDPDFAR